MSSDHQTRPVASRGGRGASRGGRGGFGSRSSTRNRGATNGDAHAKHDDSLAALEDEGEIGQLKKLYGSKTSLIKEMFPDWSDVDILFALRETDGDENLTVTRIAEGTISQWDEVSKPKKDRTKAKTATATAGEIPSLGSSRPGRTSGAGPDRSRGRSRTAERGGRAPRGRSAQPTNGTRHEKNPLSVPTAESTVWDSNHKSADDADSTPAPPTSTNHSTTTTNDAASATPIPPTSAAPAPKTWASMLRQSAVPKPVVKPKEAPAQKTPQTAPAPAPPTTVAEEPEQPEELEEAEDTEQPTQPTPLADKAAAAVSEIPVPAVALPDVSIAPSQDQLTESNLERVVDISHPPMTDTMHSEAADSWDARAAALGGASTPISASQQHQQQQAAAAAAAGTDASSATGSASKALGSGYATTALKATDRTAVRTPSYSRRVLDQEEAVRMPGNREVDRATVQFGTLNFSVADDDVDGDREEPETRTQPPDDSPVTHPRASLPPAGPPAAVPDAFAGQKQPPTGPANASGLPPSAPAAAVSASAAVPQQPPTGPASQQASSAQQYGRFAQPASQEAAFGQKPFDAYGQPSANPPFDNFQNLPVSSQPQAQQAPAAYSSAAAADYSQYYTSDAQSRMPFNYYNQAAYGQQAAQAQGQQDGMPNRGYSGYHLNDSLSQYPQSNAARFGVAATSTAVPGATDAQNSGTTTPNPPASGQQPSAQQQQQQQGVAQNGQSAAQTTAQQQQQQQGTQYPYSHPYYASPYYNQYMSHYNSFGQGNFGPYGKGGYGTHHPGYGVSPQTPYDHNLSQASAFGGASSLHRGVESNALASGLGDYGRAAGSGQPSSFGSGHDGSSFGRTTAAAAGSYQSQAGQGFGAQQSQTTSQQGVADDLKAYGDAKGTAGPSPSMGGARPGSATNTQSSQSGLPPPQSSQQGGIGGYGGYPSHLQGHAANLHGNQSLTGAGYGMSAGANQSHSTNPYGQYGGHAAAHASQGFGSNSYYGNQQQRGWGGNYH